tara:strand:- start:53427 stop:53582 length:156 start_codon:yes stop_codon:yes gene_type:complete
MADVKKSLELEHIETVEEALEILTTSGYHHSTLIGKLNQLIGYLIANEEIK